MTKTFEQLKQDADIEEFVSEVGIEESKKEEKDHDETKVVVNMPINIEVRKFDLLSKGMRETAREMSFDEAEAAFLSRGNFEEVMTQDEHRQQVVQDWAKEKEMMWGEITSQFGDPLSFLGSPFEKVKTATKLSEIIECLELAQEYLESVLEEDEEVIQEEHTEQVEIEQ